MKVIFYTRQDGGLSYIPFDAEEDLQVAIAKLGDVPHTIVENPTFPADRSKREAWRLNGRVVEVDPTRWAQIIEQRAVKVIDGMDRLQFEHLFDLENRTRVLELKAPITRLQYRQALINRWKELNA